MSFELTKEARTSAEASLLRYFRENLEGDLGHLAARQLLDFLVQEVGPSIYNQAVADVQDHLQARIQDLESDLFQEEFPYWRARDRRRKAL